MATQISVTAKELHQIFPDDIAIRSDALGQDVDEAFVTIARLAVEIGIALDKPPDQVTVIDLQNWQRDHQS